MLCEFIKEFEDAAAANRQECSALSVILQIVITPLSASARPYGTIHRCSSPRERLLSSRGATT
jgi:hypothetical protein